MEREDLSGPAATGTHSPNRPPETRMNNLRRAPVMHDQRLAADRLGEMPINLAMRAHRAAHVTAATRAQEHTILRATLRRRPKRRPTPGIGFRINAARLCSHIAPMFEHCAQFLERRVGIGANRRDPSFVHGSELLALPPG